MNYKEDLVCLSSITTDLKADLYDLRFHSSLKKPSNTVEVCAWTIFAQVLTASFIPTSIFGKGVSNNAWTMLPLCSFSKSARVMLKSFCYRRTRSYLLTNSVLCGIFITVRSFFSMLATKAKNPNPTTKYSVFFVIAHEIANLQFLPHACAHAAAIHVTNDCQHKDRSLNAKPVANQKWNGTALWLPSIRSQYSSLRKR